VLFLVFKIKIADIGRKYTTLILISR